MSLFLHVHQLFLRSLRFLRLALRRKAADGVLLVIDYMMTEAEPDEDGLSDGGFTVPQDIRTENILEVIEGRQRYFLPCRDLLQLLQDCKIPRRGIPGEGNTETSPD